MKLHLGCGNNRKLGFVNVDKIPGSCDIVMDLDKFPYPFKDNCVNEILMENILEHLGDIPRTMDELHRIIIPGSKMTPLVPYFSSYSALFWGHKYTFHYNNFAHFDIKCTRKDANYSVRQWIILESKLIFNKSVIPGLNRFLSFIFNRHKNLYTTTGLYVSCYTYKICFSKTF